MNLFLVQKMSQSIFSFLKKIFFYILILLTPFFLRIIFLDTEERILLHNNWNCTAEKTGKTIKNISMPFWWSFHFQKEKLVSCTKDIFLEESSFEEDYSLFLLNVLIAYEVYWNDTLITKRGKFLETEKFDPTPNIIRIDKKYLKQNNQLKILIYDPSGAGGIFKIPVFGKIETVQKEAFSSILWIGGLIFLCFFLFLFCILYYLKNTSQKEFLYFALVCFSVGLIISSYYKVSYYLNSSYVFNYLLFNISLASLTTFLILFILQIFELKIDFISKFLIGVTFLYLIVSLVGYFSTQIRDFQRYYMMGYFSIFVSLAVSLEIIRSIIRGKNIRFYGGDFLIFSCLVALVTLNHSYLRFLFRDIPREELNIESFLTFLLGMILSISQKQKYIQERWNTIEKNYQEDLKREIKEKTAELKQANDQLQRENIFKNKLFSILAHDLKSPLSSLEMLVELAKEKELNDEEFLNFLEEISLTLASNQFILSTLLFWISQQIEKRKIVLEPFSPVKVWEETLHSLFQKINKKNIKIQKEYGGQCLVYSDKNIIRVILRNLLDNAVKFSQPNSKIIIGFNIFEKHCEFFIQDFGMGMDEAIQKKLLEKETFSLDSSKGTEGEKGLGLGLKLSLELLNELGSEIFLDSQKEKGSKFWFRIPLAEVL